MKLPPLLIALLLPIAAFGRDTAYKALRAIGAERDPALLHRVVEVKGVNGVPQPETWKVILDDPMARGGVRELEVENGHIVSERTPVRAYTGKSDGNVMNFQKLNLDSEGAFTIAEDEAKHARVGFDSVDYVLRCDDPTAAPTWVLQLLDQDKHNVGTVTVAADTGAVLTRTFEGEGGFRRSTADTTARSGEDDTERTSETDEDRYAHTHNLGHRIDRAFHRAGADLEEFFTGRRTLDRRFEGE